MKVLKDFVFCAECGYFNVRYGIKPGQEIMFCDRPCQPRICKLPEDFCSNGVRTAEAEGRINKLIKQGYFSKDYMIARDEFVAAMNKKLKRRLKNNGIQ